MQLGLAEYNLQYTGSTPVTSSACITMLTIVKALSTQSRIQAEISA